MTSIVFHMSEHSLLHSSHRTLRPPMLSLDQLWRLWRPLSQGCLVGRPFLVLVTLPANSVGQNELQNSFPPQGSFNFLV